MGIRDTPVKKDLELPNNSTRDQPLIKCTPDIVSDHFSLSNPLASVHKNRPIITCNCFTPICTWHYENNIGQGSITSQDLPDLAILCQFRNLSPNNITELQCAVSCKRPSIMLNNMTLCVLMALIIISFIFYTFMCGVNERTYAGLFCLPTIECDVLCMFNSCTVRFHSNVVCYSYYNCTLYLSYLYYYDFVVFLLLYQHYLQVL